MPECARRDLAASRGATAFFVFFAGDARCHRNRGNHFFTKNMYFYCGVHTFLIFYNIFVINKSNAPIGHNSSFPPRITVSKSPHLSFVKQTKATFRSSSANSI